MGRRLVIGTGATVAAVAGSVALGLALADGVHHNHRHDGHSPVTISPSTGGVKTVFHVRVRIVTPNPDSQPAGDNYQIIFHGPGGAHCHGALSWRLGYPLDPDARFIDATLYPTRHGSGKPKVPTTWCRGRFRGRVELRNFDIHEHIRRERVGGLAFRVS